MTEVPSSFIFNFLLFFLVPFFISLLIRKIRLSPIAGYLLGGIVLGNFFNNFYSKDIVNTFAYFGIILLLFTIGLEINFNQILNLKKYIILGGFFQILISVFLIFFLNLLFGFNYLTAFLIAIALSSSSTTLVAKIIEDRGEESTFLGELTIGILMFQDIAFIPFLIIFISLNNQNLSFFETITDVFFGFLKSTLIIFSLYFLGKKIVPIIFNKITKISGELLNLFILVFIFSVTYLSTLLGVPTLISTFVAGILVGKTIEHRHIFSQIKPIRDFLATIFFIYIGFNLQLSLISNQLIKLIFFFIFVVILKWLTIFIIFLFFRLHSRISFSLASYLFQIDEDAFILISQGLLNKTISKTDYSFIVSVVILTLILTPVLIKHKDYIYYSLKKYLKKYLPFLANYFHYQIDRELFSIDELKLKDHIIVCGYGRVGRYICRALLLSNIPFIAVDHNLYFVEKGRKEGINIIYGDATDIDILDYLEVEKAKFLVCVVPDKKSQETIIINAKKINPKIIILTRIQKEEEQKKIKDLGSEVVVQPEFEASKSIISRLLYWQGFDKNEVLRQIKRIKLEYGLT